MIDIDLIMRGYAQYPLYGNIAFASLILNYFVIGFGIASLTRKYVDTYVLHPMWATYVQTMQILLWPILVTGFALITTALFVLGLISSATSKADSVQIKGLFKRK